MLKFADDTAIQGLMSTKTDVSYFDETNRFIQWCKTKILILNVSKKKKNLPPNLMNYQAVEIVNKYKYLWLTIDGMLN